MWRPAVVDVPFERLRHDDKPVHVAEGYGGRPIEHFPPYRFFRQVLAGDPDGARTGFREWYRQQFGKYAEVPKKRGGMRHGSLDRLVRAVHAREGSAELRAELVERAIAERVEQRLALFETLRTQGYDRARAERIVGIRRRGAVFLTGGQHRAAALRALELPALPDVVVLGPAAYWLYRKLGMI
ncbi:MAG TPA: hypothetical protein VJS92_03645 [Candidatus Polarisedimenticolaceae bacterium]|nr:hypothetical protein [Candidatus Polarisedimenticolaceae bacterium]